MSAALRASASAWKLETTRCRSTAGAIARTSSRSGMPRPDNAARAFAPSTRYCDARGPAPQLTYRRVISGDSSSSGRVERTSRTAYETSDGGAGTRRTSFCSDTSSAAPSTGRTTGSDEPVVCIECGNQWYPEPVLKSKQPIPFEEVQKTKEPEEADSDLADEELEDVDEGEDSPDNDIDLGGDDDLGVTKADDDDEDQ